MERNVYVWARLFNRQGGVWADVPVGLLKVSIEDGRVRSSAFRYGKQYLKRDDRVAIDMTALPLKDREFQIDAKKFDIFTGIKDSLPDSWGRALMEKKAGRPLREDEILLASSDFRVGFLSFSEDLKGPRRVTPWEKFEEEDRAVDLERVFRAYKTFSSEDHEKISRAMKAFLMPGSTMGGARPKANCVWKDDLWIAKFERPNDSFNFVRAEHATMNLARLAGIDVPEIDLVSIDGKSIFLVKRFDRDLKTSERRGFNSALAALEETEMSFMHSSYMEIADQIIKHSKDEKGKLLELYKRMLFNAFVNNNDDHLRNHGFLLDPKTCRYELSPAYDITPTLETGEWDRRLSIKCAVEPDGTWTRKVSKDGLLRAASYFRLSGDEAKDVYENLKRVVERRWRISFEDSGFGEKDIEVFEVAFLKGGL